MEKKLSTCQPVKVRARGVGGGAGMNLLAIQLLLFFLPSVVLLAVSEPSSLELTLSSCLLY